MEKVDIIVPAMYADHHVQEVRRVLLEIPGVLDVYASSCYKTAQVTFDPTQTDKKAIAHVLEAAGYMEPLHLPAEMGVPASINTWGELFFRHTNAHEQTKHVVQFTQRVAYSGRPLWPCPGMGVISREEEAEDD